MNAFESSKLHGMSELSKMKPTNRCAAQLKDRLEVYLEKNAHDIQDSHEEVLSWVACVMALKAAINGNFGVGALLADNNNHIVIAAHNEVFRPHFRSDAHAEMRLLSLHEEGKCGPLHDHTLYTSLESCPMCLCRIIVAGVTRVYHLADDVTGGMVNCRERLPDVWQTLQKKIEFRQAACLDVLRGLAWDIFRMNCDELNSTLARHQTLS